MTPNDTINWKQVSLYLTGKPGTIRPERVWRKHIPVLDRLFLEDIPNWWRSVRDKDDVTK